jgi:transcriptional regulator GlxA family with amidase domain
MKPLRVGLIGYNGVQALDLIGPADAFTNVEIETDNGKRQPGYEVVVIAAGGKPFRSEAGICFQAQATFRNAPPLDTLIIPGGKGSRDARISKPISKWITTRAARVRRIASVCTGIYILARTGLLDGRKVTTHWRFAGDVARCFPKLDIDPNALFLKDGPLYTAGGITSSIDLALALIEEDYGPRVALSVARDLVVYLKRPGGQTQYSEPLQFQINASDRFADLAFWMLSHLREDLSLNALAKRVCLSPRHLARRFKQTFQRTPADFVERLRLDEARRRLAEHTQTIDSVADSVGFASDDAFRRAFQRRFGVKPSRYRSVFNSQTQFARNLGRSHDRK